MDVTQSRPVPMRDLLRSLPVFASTPRELAAATAPESPEALFRAWIEQAVEDGVPEPHAMILSTVGRDGRPDARALILKDLDDEGWRFASSATSPKGVQLDKVPHAALTFYWPSQGRQVRVRGRVSVADPDEVAADFLARSAEARAETWLQRQSTVRDISATADGSGAGTSPAGVAPAWRVYVLYAETVEFFQGVASRDHVRLRYRRSAEMGGAWVSERLWA